MYDNYLAHHGIKGQKWGIRRYQNKDGTRTPAGKKRYDKADKNQKLRDVAGGALGTLGIGTTILGASTGNPLLGFSGIGMIWAGTILSTIGSNNINGSSVNSAASSGLNVTQTQNMHNYMHKQSVNHIVQQHNRFAMDSANLAARQHNHMVNNFQSFNTHMGF